MWPQAKSHRGMMWVTVGMTAAYALTMALVLYSPHSPSKVDDLLFTEELFGGPMAIACIFSILMARIEARRILLAFGIGYSILTAAIFYWTFGFEHDAQYQLMLLLIPTLGFPSVAILGLAALIR
jgi:hypothetical protein